MCAFLGFSLAQWGYVGGYSRKSKGRPAARTGISVHSCGKVAAGRSGKSGRKDLDMGFGGFPIK